MNRAQRSDVATTRTMAATMAVLYACGALTVLFAALAIDGGGIARPVLLGVTATATVTALATARWGARWSTSVFHCLTVMGTALITTAVLVSPDPATAVVCGSLMTFVAINTFFFFRGVPAGLHLVCAVTAATAALQWRGDVPLLTALAADAVVVTIGLVTRGLVDLAARATRDPLTGLTNRRGFDDALQHLIAASSRSGSPLAVALLDLDRFKQINDTEGHHAGDLVLCRVADAWRPALPRDAVLARHGGDEFALLLPGTTGNEALALVRRLSALHPDVGVSCGVTDRRPEDSAAQLMRRADHALYLAKAGGRGRAELDSGRTSDLADDLAAALADGSVRVHYQPVVDLSTGTVTGVEALARWTHPRLGPVPPDQFIPVAEQNGLIGVLGEHVLRTAMTELTPLRLACGGSFGLGVNVSGRELCDPEYPERVAAVVEATGWPASDLVLEVTESLLEAHSSVAVRALHTLRTVGLRVAIDDFGTGYSSLSRLDTLPVDIVKFDHSFIAPIATSPRRAQMLRSIAGMADALGLSLVAEGVECAEQDAVLRAEGCRYAQGYLYGRPLPLGELLEDVVRLRSDALAGAVPSGV